MNNKGLTLVELLAVIAVLGILLVIAVPTLNNVIDTSKINTFLIESKNIYRAAKIKAVDLADTSDGGIISSSGENKLDIDGNSLEYCIMIDNNAEIISIVVSNGKYIISGGSDFLSLDSESVSMGNMNNYVCE